MKVEAFIIHLARAHARAPHVEHLAQSLSMSVSVIDAVDAQTLTEEEIRRVYRSKLHRPYYPFALRKTEIACFLSHQKAWRTIIERGLDGGLVVEDDVEIDAARFPLVLDLALTNMQRSDFVRFPQKTHGERGQPVARHQAGSLIIAPRHPALGMLGQLVGYGAAKKLLSFSREFDRPVDAMVQMHKLHGVRVLSSTPVAIQEISDKLGGSTIQGKQKSLAEILARELQRTAYRIAIRLHNS